MEEPTPVIHSGAIETWAANNPETAAEREQRLRGVEMGLRDSLASYERELPRMLAEAWDAGVLATATSDADRDYLIRTCLRHNPHRK